VQGNWERALTQLNVAGEMDASTLAMVQTYREAIRCELLRAEIFAGKRSPLIFGQPDEWLALLTQALKLTAEDLKSLGIIDEIVAEPLGGAHRAKQETIERLGASLAAALARFDNMDGDTVRRERREKFLAMGRGGLAA
jgi:hypothetical protein